MSEYDKILEHINGYILEGGKRHMFHDKGSKFAPSFNLVDAVDIIKALLVDQYEAEILYQATLRIIELEAESRWHPYPAEKPEKDGEYWVSYEYEEEYFTCSANYKRGNWYRIDKYDKLYITAWRELPEPYKRSRNEYRTE